MKITFDKQIELLQYGFGELEDGNRPPFVQCDPNTVYTDDEDNVIFEDILTRGYCRELDGLTYYLINSYDNIGTICKTPSGLVSWNEGQVPTDEIQYHMDVFGADNTIMYDDFMERKGVELMTFEELQAKTLTELKTEKRDVAFELLVVSNAKGEEKDYTINLKVYNELQTQYMSKGIIAFHDDSLTMHEIYNEEESLQLMTDITLAVAYREAKYDIFITRAVLVTDKEQLALVKTEVFSENEQAYIDAIVNGAL